MSEFAELKNNLITKCESVDDVFVYLPQLNDWQKQEIAFHNTICSTEEEMHQLNAWRNFYYHRYFRDYLLALDHSKVILEIGAGTGFDALQLLQDGAQLVISDISQESVKAIKNKADKIVGENKGQAVFLVADGANLPLKNDSVDAVYLVATLHHFEEPRSLLQEIKRVLKPDSLLVFAMEPSRLMMTLTKLGVGFKKLRNNAGSSVADDNHPGYTDVDFYDLAKKYNFEIVKLKRVWLILGLWHYGAEFLYRALKLKKRLSLPLMCEKVLLLIDELLLKIPLLQKLNWHFIVVLKKR